MSIIKWKNTVALLTTICMLLGGTACNSDHHSEKDADDLAGDTFRPEDIGTVSFDISEIENAPLKSEFYICPANGTIEIEYVEGAWSDLKVDLYDTRFDERIQTGEIKNLGNDLVFSNLSGEYQYYFEIDGTRDSEGERLVFRFTK